ncbi:MAG: ABC transporter ATP-binding protein [Clostridia bacterium]|nr:ABC transporter ATP-binding protein [Clostridia bacterium]
MSILKVENLSYDYVTKAGLVHAVKEATAEFEEGKMYAIVGRSGSGKSTLISLLAGLDEPKTGEIYINGEPLSQMDRDKFRRENVGMIFQSYYLLPQLTARENVELSLELAKKTENKKKLANELLEQVGLTEFHGKKRAVQLSGGEQQRVAIARAIAPNPPIILADEPTGNLDNANSDNIVKILKELAHENNKCVIVITHASEVAAEADVVYKMNDGYLITE